MDSGDGTVLIDLDGVIWRGDSPIDGAAGGVAALRDAGMRLVFFTNNSFTTVDQLLAKLERMGVPAERDALLSSSQAAATLLADGERVLAVGGPGLREALEARHADVVPIASVARGGALGEGGDLGSVLGELAGGAAVEVGSVVMGIDPGFDYRRLAIAARAVRGGARLIATNTDATFPTSGGVVPGAGACVAAVSVASGAQAVVAGKPHEPAARLVGERVGRVSLVIGDRPDTDGAFAGRLGARFALVLSGVTPPGHGPLSPPPDVESADLAELARSLLGG